jgi:hypothetical protein
VLDPVNNRVRFVIDDGGARRPHSPSSDIDSDSFDA